MGDIYSRVKYVIYYFDSQPCLVIGVRIKRSVDEEKCKICAVEV